MVEGSWLNLKSMGALQIIGDRCFIAKLAGV